MGWYPCCCEPLPPCSSCPDQHIGREVELVFTGVDPAFDGTYVVRLVPYWIPEIEPCNFELIVTTGPFANFRINFWINDPGDGTVWLQAEVVSFDISPGPALYAYFLVNDPFPCSELDTKVMPIFFASGAFSGAYPGATCTVHLI